MRVAQYAPTNPQHHPTVPFNQCSKRCLIAGNNKTAQNLRIVLRLFRRACLPEEVAHCSVKACGLHLRLAKLL
jgi:hypothetical protein